MIKITFLSGAAAAKKVLVTSNLTLYARGSFVLISCNSIIKYIYSMQYNQAMRSSFILNIKCTSGKKEHFVLVFY